MEIQLSENTTARLMQLFQARAQIEGEFNKTVSIALEAMGHNEGTITHIDLDTGVLTMEEPAPEPVMVEPAD